MGGRSAWAEVLVMGAVVVREEDVREVIDESPTVTCERESHMLNVTLVDQLRHV